jgi:hypothetical protein
LVWAIESTDAWSLGWRRYELTPGSNHFVRERRALPVEVLVKKRKNPLIRFGTFHAPEDVLALIDRDEGEGVEEVI